MSLDTYVKGTKCWFTDVQEGWISATLNTTDVAADGKVTMTFVDDNGKVCRRTIHTQPCCKTLNSQILIP
jgi:hypothetical protein